jgi:DNA-binding transcriptional MerR regulator
MSYKLPIIDQSARPLPPALDVEEDRLLQVGEVARQCGKTVRAIHHYEEIGLLKPHKRSKGRYRLYAPDAVSRVRWIVKLHDLGMTLSQIQEILALWEAAPSAPEAMAEIRAVYDDKLAEVRTQIRRLATLERELVHSLDYLDTCETCDPNELIATCCACTVHEHAHSEPELVAGLYAGAHLSDAPPPNDTTAPNPPTRRLDVSEAS